MLNTPYRPIVALASLASLFLAACVTDTPGKDADEDTATEPPTCEPTTIVDDSAIVTDGGAPTGYACRADFVLDTDCYDKVWGVKLVGQGTAPSSVRIESPAGCDQLNGYYEDTSPDGTWESENAYNAACPGVDNHTAALICSDFDAAKGTWEVYLPSNAGGCSAWGDLELTYYLNSEDPCDPPANTPDDLCSSGDDVPAQFVHRNAFNRDGDSTIHTHILPVMEDESDNYSERTWIRNLTVTDWGDATKLYVLKKGYGIHYSGDDVVSDSSVYVLDSQNPSLNLNEGDAFMGTTFAMDSFGANEDSFEPPRVTFDWSCGVANPAHFQVIQGLPQAYAIRLDDLGIQGLGFQHRVKLRLFTGSGFASLELEGRHHDMVQIPITPSGGNYVFDFNDGGAMGIVAEGTISSSGSNKVVDFDTLILRGHDLGTPIWTLAPFSE